MKLTKNFLSIWVVTIITACGFSKQNDMQRSDEAKISIQNEGFDLADRPFRPIFDGSTLASSTNSVTCSNSSNDGIQSLSDYDLTGQSVEFKITIDRSVAGNAQVFKIKSAQSTLELYTFEYGTLDQLKTKVGPNITHRNYPSDTMHIKVDFTTTTAMVNSFEDGRWINFASLPFSGSDSVSMEYLCGSGLGSTIEDLHIAGIPQDLALGDDSAEGSSTESGTSTDMVITGSGSNMISTTSSLTCPADGDNSGAETINSFNLADKEVSVKLDINNDGSTNHAQKLTIEGLESVHLRIFKWGNNYQLKAGKDGSDFVHRDLTGNINTLKISHASGMVRYFINGFEFGATPFSATEDMKVKLECGTTSGVFSDLYIDGSQQDLNVVGDTSEVDGTDGDASEVDGTDGDASEGDGTDGDASEGDGTDGDTSGGDGSDNDGPSASTAMVITGSGSNLTSTTNSLTCPTDGDNSGVESSSSFSFADKEVTVKLDINNDGSTNHAQKLTIEGSESVHLRIFKWGHDYQLKAGKDGSDFVHRDLTGNINTLKISHASGMVRYFINGFEFGATPFSATEDMKVKLECGTTSGVFSDLYIDGSQQDLNVVGDESDDGASGSGESDDGASGGGESDNGGTNGGWSGDITNHADYSYVQKADAFFAAQRKQANDPTIYTLNTYAVPAGNIFEGVSDVYDNGLYAIYATVTGRATDAGVILNSYLKIYQGLEDWGNANGQEKKLLTQRVEDDTLLPNYLEPAAEDLGNNSYMAIAFCRYYNQFLNDGATAAELLPYYDRAYKILDYIWRTRLQTNGTDRFVARDTAGYTSTEHHINLYSFGKCMARTVPEGYDANLINNFINVADNYVRRMYDGGVGSYRIGTINNINSDAINYDDGFPADTASWRYLAQAGSINAAADTASLNWLTSPSGVWVVENAFGINNFAGVRFTSNSGAYGAQIENTGAALAALKKHGGYSEKAAQIENSLKALFDSQGNSGLQAHKDPVGAGGCCNTGLSWSYFDTPHVASTAYSILGILGENPYQWEPSSFVRVQDVIIP